MIPQNQGGSNPPTQSYEQAQQFILSLADTLDTVCDFRAIHETDRSVPAIPRRGTLLQYWDELCSWNDRGYGIYITINETDGIGRDNSNVTRFRAHMVDLDGPDATQQFGAARNWIIPPAFGVNTSPGKYHLYWPLDAQSQAGQWETVQRKLVTRWNGDPTIVDPARIMRLPGTVHRKTDPYPVVMWQLEGAGHVYNTAMLDVALWSVTPSNIGGHGGDHIPIGQGERAPGGTTEAIEMLNRIDVTEVTDRNQWVAITGAFMQAIDPADWQQAFEAYQAWNAPYPGNDPAANLKLWNDTLHRGTVVKGWGRLHSEATGMSPQQARLLTGSGAGGAGMHSAPVTLSSAPRGGLSGLLEDATIANTPSALIEVVKALVGRISVGFDTFSQQTRLLGPPPWAKTDNFPRDWTDADTVNCQLFVQTLFNDKGVLRPSKDTVFDAVSLLASHNKFNPLQDYLNALKWDGVGRIRNLLSTYFGASDTPYHQAIGAKFMVSSVARAMEPGCKVDTVLILEGKQGIKKSSSIAALAGEGWFTDELPELSNKDAAIQLVGKWIVEISELSAFNRSDTETIKKFMSRSTDRFRAPYGKVASDHPRNTVFVATTNDEHYLKDTTGNRRFWPVTCGQIDIAAIRRDRDQLWAEAVAHYRDGMQWWLTDDEAIFAEAEQDARRDVDPWEERIAAIAKLMGNHPVTVDMICNQLGIAFERQNAGINSRISKCLKLCGYDRKRLSAGLDGRRPWAYVKSNE